MRLIRSWPATIPEDRSYVVDGIERLVMDGYDYRCLADIDDDIILIEWDIAVGKEELETFIERCKAEPDRVRAAPYRLYIGHNERPIWVHRIRDAGTHRFATAPEDTHCAMFGFGLTYLPKALIDAFMATLKPKSQFTDSTFSHWHMRHAKVKQVPIDWDIHLTHLHYTIPKVV